MQLIVMDHTGDSRQDFDTKNATELRAAEERFRELTGLGFTPAKRTEPGKTELMRAFDGAVEEVVFFPRLQGG